MKTRLLFLFMVLTANINAQQSINGYYGNTMATYAIVNSNVVLDQSGSGGDIVWDFSQLTEIGTSIDLSAPPTAEELTNYPNTTSVITVNSLVNNVNESSKIYFSTNSGVSFTALVEATNLQLNYNTDNAYLGTFPLDFGYSNDDFCAGTYVYGSYTGTFTGSIKTFVDAYGILSTNNVGNGAFSGNATRLKTIQTLAIDYGAFTNVGTISQTIYSYYASGDDAPVFRYTDATIEAPSLGIFQNNIKIEKNSGVLLNTNQYMQSLNKITIQNPVEDILKIWNFDNKIIGISIYDTSGRKVLENFNESYINVNELKNGIYFATINTAFGEMTKKIIKK